MSMYLVFLLGALVKARRRCKAADRMYSLSYLLYEIHLIAFAFTELAYLSSAHLYPGTLCCFFFLSFLFQQPQAPAGNCRPFNRQVSSISFISFISIISIISIANCQAEVFKSAALDLTAYDPHDQTSPHGRYTAGSLVGWVMDLAGDLAGDWTGLHLLWLMHENDQLVRFRRFSFLRQPLCDSQLASFAQF
ncbi:hypothetical protein J3F84DRAFT_167199 [Trichoderma pleuroticola]